MIFADAIIASRKNHFCVFTMECNKKIFLFFSFLLICLLTVFLSNDGEKAPAKLTPPTYQELLPWISENGEVYSESLELFLTETEKKKDFFQVRPVTFYGGQMLRKEKFIDGKLDVSLRKMKKISQKMTLPSGDNRFTVLARGTEADGEFARMKVSVGGDVLGEVEVSEAFKEYVFKKSLPEGPHEVRLSITNDFPEKREESRTLVVTWLKVDRVKINFSKARKEFIQRAKLDDPLNYPSSSPYLIRGKVFFSERLSLLLPPPGVASLNISIPEKAVLRFGVGMDMFDIENSSVSSELTVTFSEENGDDYEIYKGSIDPSWFLETQSWIEMEKDLSPLGNKSGRLIFKTSQSGSANESDIPNLFLISNPKILTPKRSSQPNVILLSIDTLRSDHLGLYGYGKPTSPFLDRFASESVVFQRAVAQAPETLPSHMAIMTSLFPGVHRMVKASPPSRLSSTLPVWSQIMKSIGYQTAGYTSGAEVSPIYGFNRGMEVYSSKWERSEIAFNKKGVRWIARTMGHPFFLFLHTYDVHTPYEPPPPYDTMFGSTDFKSRDEAAKKGMDALTRFNRNQKVALYDGEIRYVDSQIQRFMSRLKELDVYDNSLIIIASDHGEEFMEHGRLARHGHTLYNELLFVPLIIKFPKGKWGGTVINDPVESVDIMPTVLDFLETPSPKHIQGISLLNAIKNGGSPSTPAVKKRSVFSERLIQGSDLEVSVQTLTEKYYHRVVQSDEFYDISKDPLEQKNISGTRKNSELIFQNRIKSFKRKNKNLYSLSSGSSDAIQPEMDKETEDQLRALGYLH